MMPVRILLQSPDTGDVVELGRGEIDDVGNSTGPWLRQVPGILEQIAAQLTAAMDLVDAQRVDVVEQAPEPGQTKPDPSAIVGSLVTYMADGVDGAESVEVVEQADEWVDLFHDLVAERAQLTGDKSRLSFGTEGRGLGTVTYVRRGRGRNVGTSRYRRLP